MCSVRRYLLVVSLAAASASVCAQNLFTEDFSDSASAAARFSVNGSASFSGGALTLSPGNSVMLNSANPTGDTGASPVLYSVTQSFAAGSVVWPQYTAAQFRVRANSASWNDGYYLHTFYSSAGASIGLDRITDAEIAQGIFAHTLIGGTLITPPVISSLGPYDLGLSFVDTPSAVNITVLVNGIPAVSVQDTSPYRLTQGDSLGFLCSGTHAASWDSLNVTVVPEPGACALLALGVGFCLLRKAILGERLLPT